MSLDLRPGSVIWVDLTPIKGRERGGHRPAVVISSADYLTVITELIIVLPATTVNRDWPNHVLLNGPTGFSQPTYAMTEQPRTISRDRITDIAGYVDRETLSQLAMWLRDWSVAGDQD